MRQSLSYVFGFNLLIVTTIFQAGDMPRAFIQNEDSHPHQVPSGEVARFYLEPGTTTALMDVKCSLEGDDGQPLSAVTLRTHGLTDVQWPFPTRTIRVDIRLDFDIVALAQPELDKPPYYEFVNEDRTRSLWHLCYNN
jgi:hypothetical protein